MELPKRTKQQKSEAHSYAVLLYKLRDLGIFRSLTSNDYGIDFELELVRDDQVTGRTVKVQVKSADTLRLRTDGTPSVGGIKQSTLNYWCELSYRTNVLAYVVDLSTESIYVSRSLFWQATQSIDGGDASKSIEFMAAGEDVDWTAKAATLILAFAPTAADHVYAHTLALRKIGDFCGLLTDAHHYDAGTEIQGAHFRDLLEASRILLWKRSESLWKDENDRKYWTNYEYWKRKSERDGWDGISCYAAQPVLGTLLPALVAELRICRDKVIAGKYYWAHRNPAFLRLVFATSLPERDDPDALIQFSYRGDHNGSMDSYQISSFLKEARVPKARKAKKRKQAKKARPNSRYGEDE